MIKPKRYLIIGAFGKGALEHQFVRGLRKLDHSVEQFDMQTSLHEKRKHSVWHRAAHRIFPARFVAFINQDLLQFLKGKNFDTILIFKGMQLLPATVEAIKQHTRFLINYNPDHPFEFYSPGSGNAFVRDSIRHYDLYLSYADSIVQKLRHQFGVRAECLPFGYDESFSPDWSAVPDQRFVFIGAWDKERAAFFNQFEGEDLAIFGNPAWQSIRNGTRVRRFFQGSSLYNMDYQKMIGGANGVINVLRPQNILEQSHNMRTFEVPGAGGLLISQRTEEQMMFFEDGKEAIFFDTPAEMNERLRFLRKRPQDILRLKKAAFERSIRSGYGYDARMRQLDIIIDQVLFNHKTFLPDADHLTKH